MSHRKSDLGPAREKSAKVVLGSAARSAHSRQPLRRSQSAHRPRRHDRSPPEPTPVSFVPFDIRPEHPLAPTEPACSSNSREKTTATPARPALRRAPASATPGSDSSRSYPAQKHIAQRHQRNACLSWVSRCRRSPERHRCRRRAYPLEPPCFVTQPIQKRVEPTSKLVSPIRPP